MTRTKKNLLTLLLLLALGGGLAGHRELQHQRAQLDARQAGLTQLELAVRQSRRQLAATNQAQAVAADSVARKRAEIAILEGSPTKLWPFRVHLLKQLLSELPSQRIPELRLLEALDWIEVARNAELDTPANIRASLAALRSLARKKFALHLQEAVRRFAAESDGNLPGDILQLTPFLTAPADREILERYTMTRSGKLADSNEKFAIEKPTSDMILSIGPNSWNIGSSPNFELAPGESELAALDRLAESVGTALGDALGSRTAEGGAPKQMMRSLTEIVGMLAHQMETAFGSSDAFGNELKSAAKAYLAAHPHEPLANFSQVTPYLKNADQFLAIIEPVMLQLQYRVDHEFKAPADAAELQSYAEKSFKLRDSLHLLKVTADDKSLTWSFSFDNK